MMVVSKLLSRGFLALGVGAALFAFGQGTAGASSSDQGTATITFQTNSSPIQSVTCHVFWPGDAR